MNLRHRHNVHTLGEGPSTVLFAHGFGCDQNMWRLMAPHYAQRHRVVTFDLMGSGGSDLDGYDRSRYASLQGHADDVCGIVAEFAADSPVIFVGHSVSAMIGVLADLASSRRFAAHVMIGPSPCYVDDADYVGGFSRADIDGLLETLESNYLGWSSNMAPAIVGAPDQPELAVELTNSFCRTDPDIAKHFARVTFLSDNRADLPRLESPALIVQSSDDLIAPLAVGEYLQRTMPNGTLLMVDNVGHCPHLSAPHAVTRGIDEWLVGVMR